MRRLRLRRLLFVNGLARSYYERLVWYMDNTAKHNTHGTPGDHEEADTASGGAPEERDATEEEGRADEKSHTKEDPADAGKTSPKHH